MSAEKPYYYWDPIGNDPEQPGKPEYVQLRARSFHQWETDAWGFSPNGLENCCWRLGMYVACHPEDDLAIISLFYLLDNRLRYFGEQPERAKPWYEKLKRYKHPRRTFTRDPIIAGLFGLMIAGRHDLVKELHFPWRISLWHSLTPSVWAWIKFLQTGKGKFARLFHLFVISELAVGNKLNNVPMFSRHLKSLMLFLCPNEDCSTAVMQNVSPDNLLLYFLNDYDDSTLLLSKPGEYISRKGWQWEHETLNVNPPIPEDEPIKLDKELLHVISQLWTTKKLQENPMNLLNAMFGNGSPGSIRN